MGKKNRVLAKRESVVPAATGADVLRTYINMLGDMLNKVPGWVWMAAFAVLWLGLRVPWLPCDGGVPSFWEYGYFVTDEGYYLYGGKEKFLHGSFVNLTRHEAFTYGYAPLLHWISYLTHLVCGHSGWAWRVPFAAVNFAAWLAMFRWCAKRAGAAAAFALCAAVSSAPLVVEYERTASNDVFIGSLLVLSFCAACSRKVWGWAWRRRCSG